MRKIFVILMLSILIFNSCEKQTPSQNEAITTGSVKSQTLAKQHMLGLVPAKKRDYQKNIRYDLINEYKDKTPPSVQAIDLTSLFPSPGDQGLQGSCVSWAVGYATKSYWEKQEIGWDLSTLNHLYSPQYIYAQTHVNNTYGGGGSYFSDALNLVNNQGVATLDICSYDAYDPYGFQTPIADNMRMQAYRFRNIGWSALPYRSIRQIKDRLLNGEPVLLGIPIYPDFDNLSFGNDTYDNLSGTLRGYHAITLIGFDNTRNAFKFINQWGTGWGLNGYGWISYDLISNNDFESYVMFDAKNPLYGDTWASTSTAGISTIGLFSGDMNGDGNTDVIQPWDNNGTLAIIAHDVSGSATSIICNNTILGAGSSNVGMVSADYNGDGKSDIIQAWKNGTNLALTIFKSSGTSFTRVWDGTMTSGYQNVKLLPVDMDGDGKTDIAQIWDNAGKVGIIIYRSTGSSYYNYYSTTLTNGIGGDYISEDYNGDGKTDIIQLWNNNGSLGAFCIKSFGSSYSNSWSGTFNQGYGNVGFVPVDYNGDGKMDFIQGWRNSNNLLSILLYSSTGSGFTYVSNSDTRNGYQNLELLSFKQNGQLKTGLIQCWNNNLKTSFIRYMPLEYN